MSIRNSFRTICRFRTFMENSRGCDESVTSGPGRHGFFAAAGVLHVTFAIMAWRAERNPLLTFLLPLSFVLYLYIIWRSAWVTLRQGGVVWRDTFYSLDTLRRGMV